LSSFLLVGAVLVLAVQLRAGTWLGEYGGDTILTSPGAVQLEEVAQLGVLLAVVVPGLLTLRAMVRTLGRRAAHLAFSLTMGGLLAFPVAVGTVHVGNAVVSSYLVDQPLFGSSRADGSALVLPTPAPAVARMLWKPDSAGGTVAPAPGPGPPSSTPAHGRPALRPEGLSLAGTDHCF